MQVIIVANSSNNKEKYFFNSIYRDAIDKSLNKINLIVEFVNRETIYASWSRGVKKSTNEFILITNIDDAVYPEPILDIVQAMLGSNISLASGPMDILRNNVIEEVVINEAESVDLSNCLVSGAFVIRKQQSETLNCFDSRFQIVGDYDFQMRHIKAGKKLLYSKHKIGLYRDEGKGISTSNNPLLQLEQQTVYYIHKVKHKIKVYKFALVFCWKIIGRAEIFKNITNTYKITSIAAYVRSLHLIIKIFLKKLELIYHI